MVATFSVLGDMVGRIGGEHVAVTTLVGANGDTHVYQPTPADARAVSDANILVVNGLEFEGWLDRLIDASDFDGVRVVATDGIDPIAYEEGDHDDHDDHGHKEDGHDDHAHDDHGHKEDGHDDHAHDDHGHKEDGHDTRRTTTATRKTATMITRMTTTATRTTATMITRTTTATRRRP